MKLEKASEIVGAMIHHIFFWDGITEKQSPSLAKYSLLEKVEANQMVKEANRVEREQSQKEHRSCRS